MEWRQWFGPYIEEGKIQKKRQRSSPLLGGQNLFNTLTRYICFVLGKLEEKDVRIATWWFEEKVELILFFKIILVQNIKRGEKLNKFCPTNRSDDLCLFFCIYPSSMLSFSIIIGTNYNNFYIDYNRKLKIWKIQL